MPLDNFKEIVDKKGYRVERDDREIFEQGLNRTNIGRGFSDYIEFILYDSNDNQLPQGEDGKMIRYIPLTRDNIDEYFQERIISENESDDIITDGENYILLGSELNKKSNDSRQLIVDTEKLIKEAGYENGVFKTHTAIINRRVGSERPPNEESELVFEDSLWIQEISPSRTEIRVLPMRDENDDIKPDLELRYNVFLNNGQFYDDTIYYVNRFVQSLDLDTIIGSFLTLRGSKEKGRKFRDLIKKEFGIPNWERFIEDIREQWIESVRYFVRNYEWRLTSPQYGTPLNTIPSPELSITKIRQIVQEALIHSIEKFLPKRDIQEESILTPEEQESYDKTRNILKTLKSDKTYTNNDIDARDPEERDETEDDEVPEFIVDPIIDDDDDDEEPPTIVDPPTRVSSTEPDVLFTYQKDYLAISVRDETDPKGTTITGRRWEWGDGDKTSTLRSARHSYSTPGTYNVILRVYYTNEFGLKSSKTYQEEIAVIAQPPIDCRRKLRDNINPEGELRLTCDGRKYVWNVRQERWVRLDENEQNREGTQDNFRDGRPRDLR